SSFCARPRPARQHRLRGRSGGLRPLPSVFPGLPDARRHRVRGSLARPALDFLWPAEDECNRGRPCLSTLRLLASGGAWLSEPRDYRASPLGGGRMNANSRVERRLVSIAAAFLGLFNILLAMFRAPLAGIGQIRHVVPGQAIGGSGFVLVLLGIILLINSRGMWHGKK